MLPLGPADHNLKFFKKCYFQNPDERYLQADFHQKANLREQAHPLIPRGLFWTWDRTQAEGLLTSIGESLIPA